MNIQQAINTAIERKDLSREEMRDVFNQIFSGELTDAQIAGLLVALRMKGETVDEITAAAEVMREFSSRVNVSVSPLTDIVGTGGDGLKTLNVSTASAMVLAAAGGHVAKHGNRAASSQSGSADLLEKAGAKIDLTADKVAECIEQTGIGFMFAPVHHGAMKHAIGPRKEMATRTVFNILGPLTNPASAKRMLLGVYSADLLEPMAQTLKSLGCERAMVIHGQDGIDEISVCDKTSVIELKDGELQTYELNYADFGIDKADIKDLVVEGAQQSLEKIQAAFRGEKSAAFDIISLNSAAAIYVAGLAENIHQGYALAKNLMTNGKAQQKFDDYVQFTNNAG